MTNERRQEIVDQAVKFFTDRSIARDHMFLFSVGASFKDTQPYRENETLIRLINKALKTHAQLILTYYHRYPAIWIEPDIMLQLEAVAEAPIHV